MGPVDLPDPLAHLGEAAETRPQVETCIMSRSTRQQAIQHVDRAGRLIAADTGRFRQRRAKERLASFIA